MPWTDIKLNDGTSIPSIAFGTWTSGSGQTVIDKVDQAFEAGFDHIDTAQSYRNEAETGKAIRESGLKREQIYITTKFSGLKDVETSIQDSLNNLGVKYVDLYLVHGPSLAKGDIPGLWAKMEKIKEAGFAKSIGVSNFCVNDLKVLLGSAKVLPVVNQIEFHPYIYSNMSPVHVFGNQHGIISEAYSPLKPLTRLPGGPLDKPLSDIATRLNATPEQILLAWVKAKGAVAVTYSSKTERLEGYLKAGDLELSEHDIATLEEAGAKKCWLGVLRNRVAKRVVPLVALAAGFYVATRCLGL